MNPEKPIVPAQPKLNELAPTLPIEQPEPLVTFLAERGIQTLADVRRAGGLGRMEGLPLAADHPAVRRLEALANLSAISPDAGVSSVLIEQGYDSLLTIARAPRTEFVAAVRDQVGDFKAARIHVEARAQSMYLNNVLTGILAARANGHALVPYGDVQAIESAAQKCGCKDCKAAVSPLAYLADLLDYPVHHLKQTGGVQASSSAFLRMSALPHVSADDNGNDGNGSNGGNGSGKPTKPRPPEFTSAGDAQHGWVNVTLNPPLFPKNVVKFLFYTLDDGDPDPLTADDPQSPTKMYSEPIPLTNTTSETVSKEVRAIAAYQVFVESEGIWVWITSEVKSETYTLGPMPRVPAPTITPSATNGCTLYRPAFVWISAISGASIQYKLNNAQWEPCTGPINLDNIGDITVSAKAYISGNDHVRESLEVSASFTVIKPPDDIPGRGLMGEYYEYDNTSGSPDYFDDLKLVRTDARINFLWGSLSPDSTIAPDNFSVRWTGLIEPLYSEEYTFYAVSDDGVRVYIDGKSIIDNWNPQPATEASGTIALTAGKKHSIRIEYFERTGVALVMLLWSSAHQAKEIVPQNQLYPSVDLQFLANMLHQPFDKLPASCDAADEQFRQARLCIEVLRSYLSAKQLPAAGSPQQVALSKAEQAYLLAAYTSLLTRLGTSFAEIRLARSADAETRRALAERLGIDLKILPDSVSAGLGLPQGTTTLDALYMDQSASTPTAWLLTEENLEKRFGLRNTQRNPLDTNRAGLLEGLRLDHLHTLWTQQDWPIDPYSPDYQPQDERLPVINPDLIGPDDFRHRDLEPTTTPFAIWKARRDWVDSQIQTLATIQKARPKGNQPIAVPDLNGIFDRMYQSDAWASTTPVTDFDQLYRKLTSGMADEVKDARDRIKKDLGLAPEAFSRLMEIRAKEKLSWVDLRNEAVQDDEWRELYSMLVQVQKTRLFASWVTEESAANISFGPSEFWNSLHEPKEGDWPPVFVVQHVLNQPVIDPELIESNALPIAGTAAVVLWQGRRAKLGQLHKALKAERESPAGGFDAMLRLVLGTPNSGDPLPLSDAELNTLYDNLKTGVNTDSSRETIRTSLYMTGDSFLRLMDIKKKDADAGTGNKPTEAEYEEVYSLLTSAQKAKREYQGWLEEEEKLPLIDPESVKLEDLPDDPLEGLPYDPASDARANSLWKGRRQELDDDSRALKDKREDPAGGFDAMLTLALGLNPGPLPTPGSLTLNTLIMLYNNLNAGNDLENTQATITTRLHMTVEDFTRVMTVRAKDHASTPPKPTTGEYAEVYAILTTAQKIGTRYSVWTSEENPPKKGTSLDYQQAFKAKLPRWRASAEARQQWKQALRTHSSAPIIDLDLIGPGDLKNPVKDDAAFDLWTSRNNWLSNTDPPGLWQKLQAAQASGGLDAMIELETVKPASDLWKLDNERSKGNDIASRLEQFSLDNPSFSYLLRIRNLIADNQSILQAEWEAVHSILVQVSKRRKFAEWREQERQAGLTLSPVFFRFPEEDKTIFPPPPPPWEPVPWRSTWEMRRDWQDTLQARMDQEEAVTNALGSVVSAIEEATLPMLRDALIIATDAEGTKLEEKAKWITKRLLIDTRVSGCQMTTRVAQAIETIQGLLWSLRTGQLKDKDAYPDLDLVAPDFDEEWEWIGSYASWRAAMFVFMYPENILLPSLRKHQTPAFRALVNELRNNRRLTPEQARQAAQTYSDYFRDVCSLVLEACAKARGWINSANNNGHTDESFGDLTFLFARSPVSRTAYWCTRDAQAMPGSQTYWDQIPGLQEVTGLIGAVVRDPDPSTGAGNKPPAKDSFIYLFASIRKDNQQKLVLIKYSLERQQWVSEPIELKPPKSDAPYTLVRLKQAQPFQQPYVGIWYGDDEAYGRMLNEKGDDWAGDAFDNVVSVLALGDQKKILVSDLSQYADGGDVTQVDVRFSAVDRYRADREKSYRAAFPTFHEDGTRFDIAFLTSNTVEFRDLLKNRDLNNPIGHKERIRSVNLYARNNGFVGGFPDFEQGGVGDENIVYGSYLIKPEVGEFRIVSRATLQNSWSSGANLEDIADRFKAVDAYAMQQNAILQKDYWLSGFPTFTDYYYYPPTPAQYLGVVLIKKSIKVVKDLEPYVPPCSYSGFAPKAVPIQITERLAKDQLEARKDLSRTTYLANDAGPRPNLDYIKEAFYFVPIYIALQLQQRGHYMAALDWFRTIYNYSAPLDPPDQRKIYYGLIKEEELDGTPGRPSNWLLDPLNPHSIAETRPNTYTRYTLFSLIRCFLAYADAEFTRDTSESVPRARALYLKALELLDTLQDAQQPEPCEACIRELDTRVYPGILSGAPQWLPVWFEIKRELAAIPDLDELKKVVDGTNADGVSDALGKSPWSAALSLAWQRIRDAEAALPATRTMAEVLRDKTRLLDTAYTALMASPVLAEASLAVGNGAGNRFLQSVSTASGISMATLQSEKVDLPWLRNPLMNLANGQRTLTAVATTATGVGVSVNTAQVDVQLSFGYVPILTFQFCIPPNPVLNALKLHAELNLYKLRNCRNIAGMRRQLDAYAAPTDTTSGFPMIGAGGQLILPGTVVLHPTPYRYKILIERSKQLVSIAQQMEAAMLAALEKRDLEAYNLLKARQDVSMARAGVQLQNLRVTESKDSAQLATLQRNRAQFQADNFDKWINEPLTTYEQAMIAAYVALGLQQYIAATAQGVLTGLQMPTTAAFTGGYGVAAYQTANAVKTAADQMAILAQSGINILGIYASQERRKQDWEFQKELALKDVEIGNQQIKIAEDHERIVGQEFVIAEMQRDHAEAMVEFLSTKFTNVELYEWMSGVLQNAYSFFLQQATSMANLAENQLAFERQETPPSYIQSDYWEAPSDEMGTNGDGRAPDRHGLTGSARLLQDTYQLDQYAFENDKRKLQLSKTISLARMAPYEFQRFRETGVLPFATPIDLFDRDFPGHYLRLIKRVRTSVVALIPPTQGIHATLTNGGHSRVVIGPDVFQTVVVRRDPESVALTAPMNASGLFELEPQSEMLFPFEGLGVGTSWEFRMPKAANLFDYYTIADVLLTIEYTALDSFDYRQQVIQTLSSTISGDRPFSFRQEFADAWYDLHNPDQATPPPMTVTFETRREDFPPNITDLKIQHVLLYFACTDGNVFEENVTLKFKAKGEANAVGGEAKPNDGVISTRRGNAGSWLAMTDKKSPAGVWTLSLAPETRQLFDNEVIEDILLVITYSGRTLEWPA